MQHLRNGMNTNFKSVVVEIVYSLVVCVFVGHEEGDTDWLLIWVSSLEEKRFPIVFVQIVGHSFIES